MVLYQPANGYCYNSDTHILYNFICKNLDKFKNINGELLDIGSGSGILGLLVAREFQKLNLNQCEIQNVFQFFSEKNSQTNNIKSLMYKGSFINMNFDKKFDICISNPPFYHSNVIKSINENLRVARYNDSMPLRNFIEKVSTVLKDNGKFFFCYDAKQINEIMLLISEFRLNLEALQFVHPNAQKDASLVLVYVRKNSKSLVKILNPLISFDENGQFSNELNGIYEKCSTYSIKVDFE